MKKTIIFRLLILTVITLYLSSCSKDEDNLFSNDESIAIPFTTMELKQTYSKQDVVFNDYVPDLDLNFSTFMGNKLQIDDILSVVDEDKLQSIFVYEDRTSIIGAIIHTYIS